MITIEGWKWVPIDPTEAMLLAAEISKPRGFQDLYRAMISAAPAESPENIPAFIAALDAIVEDYIEHYELDDGDAHHTPNSHEQLLIADAIFGLLMNEEFLSVLVKTKGAK